MRGGEGRVSGMKKAGYTCEGRWDVYRLCDYRLKSSDR